MRIGALKHQVQIQKHGTAQDAAGQTVQTWTTLATVRANIRHQSGAESIRSDASTSAVKVSIRIRYRTDVTAAMRVVHGATVYQILAVLPDLERHDHVDLVCEVTSAG